MDYRQMFRKHGGALVYLVVLLLYLQQSVVTWHGNKLVCEQIGEKRCRGWTHCMEEDKLHLVRQE